MTRPKLFGRRIGAPKEAPKPKDRLELRYDVRPEIIEGLSQLEADCLTYISHQPHKGIPHSVKSDIGKDRAESFDPYVRDGMLAAVMYAYEAFDPDTVSLLESLDLFGANDKDSQEQKEVLAGFVEIAQTLAEGLLKTKKVWAVDLELADLGNTTHFRNQINWDIDFSLQIHPRYIQTVDEAAIAPLVAGLVDMFPAIDEFALTDDSGRSEFPSVMKDIVYANTTTHQVGKIEIAAELARRFRDAGCTGPVYESLLTYMGEAFKHHDFFDAETALCGVREFAVLFRIDEEFFPSRLSQDIKDYGGPDDGIRALLKQVEEDDDMDDPAVTYVKQKLGLK